jgi:hypothetical protein
VTEEEQLALYEKEMGARALERQLALKKSQCADCGMEKPMHHPLCPRRKRVRAAH